MRSVISLNKLDLKRVLIKVPIYLVEFGIANVDNSYINMSFSCENFTRWWTLSSNLQKQDNVRGIVASTTLNMIFSVSYAKYERIH